MGAPHSENARNPRVGAFWDRQAERYNDSTRRGDNHHQRTADRLEAELDGVILCVGGLWAAADRSRTRGRVTVVDLATRMLRHFATMGVGAVRGDALALPFAEASFDHAVLPLVLHHVTGEPGDRPSVLVGRAIREAVRVVRPGGRLWVKEIVVSAPVYWAEKIAAPVTRRLLGRAGIPLVIFHPANRFRACLLAAGCRDVEIWSSGAPGERWSDIIAPIIGLPWLKVPRILVPVRYVLIAARVGTPAVAPQP